MMQKLARREGATLDMPDVRLYKEQKGFLGLRQPSRACR